MWSALALILPGLTLGQLAKPKLRGPSWYYVGPRLHSSIVGQARLPPFSLGSDVPLTISATERITLMPLGNLLKYQPPTASDGNKGSQRFKAWNKTVKLKVPTGSLVSMLTLGRLYNRWSARKE